jgi:CheY-like chemotaxis protein
MRLLLVEDDGIVGEGVRTGLRREGFTVDWVKDGVAAELAAANDDYALILLDLGLPRKDGIVVLKALRRKGGHVPILILTARAFPTACWASITARTFIWSSPSTFMSSLLACMRSGGGRRGVRIRW